MRRASGAVQLSSPATPMPLSHRPADLACVAELVIGCSPDCPPRTIATSAKLMPRRPLRKASQRITASLLHPLRACENPVVVPAKPGLGISDTGAGYLDYPPGASRQCGLIHSARLAGATSRRRWQTSCDWCTRTPRARAGGRQKDLTQTGRPMAARGTRGTRAVTGTGRGEPGREAVRLPHPAGRRVHRRLRRRGATGSRTSPTPSQVTASREHEHEGTGPARRASRERGRPGAEVTATPLLELVVGGMTCSACAARIERRLNRLDGVSATVSYATERAYVTSTGGRDTAELISVIEATGYTAVAAGREPDQDEAPGRAAAARPAAGGVRPARRGGDRHGHGARGAVPRLAVGEPAAGRPGRRLGRLAVPPGRLAGARPRHRDHGHAGQPGRQRLARLVALRPVHRQRGHDRHADAVQLRAQPRPAAAASTWTRRRA